MNAIIIGLLLLTQPVMQNSTATLELSSALKYYEPVDLGKSMTTMGPMKFYVRGLSETYQQVGEFRETATPEKVTFEWAVKQPSYSVSAVKDSILGDRAHITLTVTQDGKEPIIYDRYVDDADWVRDAKAVTADMTKYVMDRQVKQESIEVKGEKAVTMDDAEVATKIQAVADEKSAVQKAKDDAQVEKAKVKP